MTSCSTPILKWRQQKHFQSGDNKTIVKNLEKQFVSVIKLKHMSHIYCTSQKFWKEI